jgi:hypothetical protein
MTWSIGKGKLLGDNFMTAQEIDVANSLLVLPAAPTHPATELTQLVAASPALRILKGSQDKVR